MPRPCPITESELDQIVKLYESGLSTNKIGAAFNASKATIAKYLRIRGVVIKTASECGRLPLRQDAFSSVLNDPSAAYWVGFLMADGCVSDTGIGPPHVILVLSVKDRDHVVSFRTFMGSSHKIQTTTNSESSFATGSECSRLDLVSAQLASDLGKYGVIPRKTGNQKVTDDLAFNRHFWRGYIDGNGSLHISGRDQPVLQADGSLDIISQFREFCRSVAVTNANPHRGHGDVWQIAFSCTAAVAIAKVLYSDCETFLPRKKAIADEFIRRDS